MSNDSVNGGFINLQWDELREKRCANGWPLKVPAQPCTLFAQSNNAMLGKDEKEAFSQRGGASLKRCGVNIITMCFGNDVVP